MVVSFKSAIVENRRAVLKLTDPELASIMPILQEARERTAKGLSKFIKKEGDSTYTAHKHQALMVQLDRAMKDVTDAAPKAMLKELRGGSLKAGRLSIEKLTKMVEEGEKRFRDAVTPMRIPIVKVLTNVQRTMMGRHEQKSERYADGIGDRVRREMAIGVVRGESVNEIAKRLVGMKADKMSASDKADAIADKQLFANEYEAERLVRTELVNAYTETQIESLGELDADDPGWKKMWDAANDDRVCDDCNDLDGVVVDHDELFPGGIQGPPLHPNDRCTIVPWRDDWGSSRGVL